MDVLQLAGAAGLLAVGLLVVLLCFVLIKESCNAAQALNHLLDTQKTVLGKVILAIAGVTMVVISIAAALFLIGALMHLAEFGNALIGVG